MVARAFCSSAFRRDSSDLLRRRTTDLRRTFPAALDVLAQDRRAALDAPSADDTAGSWFDIDFTFRAVFSFDNACTHRALPVIASLVEEAHRTTNMLRHDDSRVLHKHGFARRSQAATTDQTSFVAFDHRVGVGPCAAAEVTNEVFFGHCFRIAAGSVHASQYVEWVSFPFRDRVNS